MVTGIHNCACTFTTSALQGWFHSLWSQDKGFHCLQNDRIVIFIRRWGGWEKIRGLQHCECALRTKLTLNSSFVFFSWEQAKVKVWSQYCQSLTNASGMTLTCVTRGFIPHSHPCYRDACHTGHGNTVWMKDHPPAITGSSYKKYKNVSIKKCSFPADVHPLFINYLWSILRFLNSDHTNEEIH